MTSLRIMWLDTCILRSDVMFLAAPDGSVLKVFWFQERKQNKSQLDPWRALVKRGPFKENIYYYCASVLKALESTTDSNISQFTGQTILFTMAGKPARTKKLHPFTVSDHDVVSVSLDLLVKMLIDKPRSLLQGAVLHGCRCVAADLYATITLATHSFA